MQKQFCKTKAHNFKNIYKVGVRTRVRVRTYAGACGCVWVWVWVWVCMCLNGTRNLTPCSARFHLKSVRSLFLHKG